MGDLRTDDEVKVGYGDTDRSGASRFLQPEVTPFFSPSITAKVKSTTRSRRTAETKLEVSIQLVGMNSSTPMFIPITVDPTPQVIQAKLKQLADKLCEKYPTISTHKGVFNGKPHLKGTRFTVADVISAVCIDGSMDDALAQYDNRYTDEQFKDALRYARDFLFESLSK